MIAMGTIIHNPRKSTTGAHPRAFAFARAAALAAVLALVIVCVGCSSARKREDPTNIVGNLRFRDSATERQFAQSYRSGSLYQDFRTVLLADAIAMDLPYRQGYVQMVSKTYMLSDADTRAMAHAQEAEFASTFSLLVFLYGGSNRPIPLGEAASPWRVLLQDDDGQVLVPATIEKLRPESAVYQYLSIYFYGLDRWSQAFRISFPKLDKVLLAQRFGKQPMTLIVTGLGGTVRMVWLDPSVFYGSPGPPVPSPAATGSSEASSNSAKP
jgi:hypothetical protein